MQAAQGFLLGGVLGGLRVYHIPKRNPKPETFRSSRFKKKTLLGGLRVYHIPKKP